MGINLRDLARHVGGYSTKLLLCAVRSVKANVSSVGVGYWRYKIYMMILASKELLGG